VSICKDGIHLNKSSKDTASDVEFVCSESLASMRIEDMLDEVDKEGSSFGHNFMS
jgi:hypothetical protein